MLGSASRPFMSPRQAEPAATRSGTASREVDGAVGQHMEAAAPQAVSQTEMQSHTEVESETHTHSHVEGHQQEHQQERQEEHQQKRKQQQEAPRKGPPLQQDSHPNRSEQDPTAPAEYDPRQAQVAPARDIVRLFQCRLCSLPFEDPITLPCGKSICRRCLPETHARPTITYPAQPERLQGFQCPFDDCDKMHSLGDCNVDVILNKAAHHMMDQIEYSKAEAQRLELTTQIALRDPWHVAGVSTLKNDENDPRIIRGGKLAATWAMAAEGDLKFEAEVSYYELPASLPGEELVEWELEALNKARELTRAEMDCQVCYALFYDPLTTGCGHTFCRPCLHRILDHSRYCPICRRKLTINPLLNRNLCPSNNSISNIINTFWKDEIDTRKETAAAELAARDQDLELPLFVCTLSFPFMPTFLHVFEPRYRLMIRRVLEGDRTFGMVMPKRPRHSEDATFCELGTLLRLVNVQFYPDGRSLVETVGLSRFRVLRHGSLDGYIVCKTERIDDISLEDEEAKEIAEVVTETEGGFADVGAGVGTGDGTNPHATHSGNGTQGQNGHHDSAGIGAGLDPSIRVPRSAADTETMSTQDLMRFATAFVARMRNQSVPWLTERMLHIYGECPEDPAIFPWWLASMLPVKDLEKYRLLGTSSVRDRLKICCSWIIEWQTRAWMDLIDGRSGLYPGAPSSESSG